MYADAKLPETGLGQRRSGLKRTLSVVILLLLLGVAAGVEWLLREALVNLMDNAIKYTPEEGAITLRIERSPDGVVLGVRDTGPGMTETDIRKAGRRFRRGRAGKRGHGAGLGLAIVHTIMQRHGGVLRIEPADPGVQVSLVFPADQGFPGKSSF